MVQLQNSRIYDTYTHCGKDTYCSRDLVVSVLTADPLVLQQYVFPDQCWAVAVDIKKGSQAQEFVHPANQLECGFAKFYQQIKRGERDTGSHMS